MYHSIHVTFIPRTSKVRSNGKVPIYMRIAVNGRRVELSTSRTIDPKRWDSSRHRVKGSKPDARAINNHLNRMEHAAFSAQTELLQEGKEVTAKSIKLRITGKDQVQKTLLEVFKEHNRKMKSLVGKDYAEATFKKYRTALQHVEDFLQQEYGDTQYTIDNVDLSFIEGFEYYLKTKPKNPCSHNSTMKYLSHLKKIINIALKKGWLKADPFEGYNKKYAQKDPVFLSQDELNRIEKKQFDIERLSRIRDVFIFSCYTGLSFSDAQKLTQNDIKQDKNGELYLHLPRTKTDKASKIMLLPKAIEIINRYKGDPETQKGNLLPMISNQKTNAYLKEIADIAGVDKKLTFHSARHTFATTVTLENGVPIETVQEILGHSQLKTTMHYARVTPGKVNSDMKALRDKLQQA